MSEDVYQVLFWGGNGPEQLSDPESREDAEHTARELTRKGYTVGSVMDVDSARRYMQYTYSPTYRGVAVPDGLRVAGQPRQRYDDWRRGVDTALAVMRPAVGALTDDSPCSLDHHGYCQEHGLPGAIPCPDGEAQRLLEATKKEGEQ